MATFRRWILCMYIIYKKFEVNISKELNFVCFYLILYVMCCVYCSYIYLQC